MNYKTDFHHWLAAVSRTDSNFTCNLEVDFLPFATQGGANVQAQPDYAANPRVLTGFTSGIALSPQLNKAWRQGVFFSAVIAQFIATVRNENVIDDGNLEGKIQQHWQSLLQLGYFLDVGVANALLINNPITPAGTLTFLAPQDGTEVDVLVSHTNTGAVTLNWMGVGGHTLDPVVQPIGTPLTGGEMVAGGVTKLIYKGGNWLLQTSALSPVIVGNNIDFYVNASTGSDGNSGLSPGSAWQTLQFAYNYLKGNINLNGHVATIHCTGVFNAGLDAEGPVTGSSGPTSVVFSFTSASSITATNSSCFVADSGAVFTVTSTGTPLALSATGTGTFQGYGLLAANNGFIVASGISIGSCTTSQITAQFSGANINLSGAINVSGTSPNMILAGIGGSVAVQTMGATFTSSSAVYTTATVACTQLGTVSLLSLGGVSFSGSATGVRYAVSFNGVINTNGAGSTFIFGSSAGTITTGGQYS